MVVSVIHRRMRHGNILIEFIPLLLRKHVMSDLGCVLMGLTRTQMQLDHILYGQLLFVCITCHHTCAWLGCTCFCQLLFQVHTIRNPRSMCTYNPWLMNWRCCGRKAFTLIMSTRMKLSKWKQCWCGLWMTSQRMGCCQGGVHMGHYHVHYVRISSVGPIYIMGGKYRGLIVINVFSLRTMHFGKIGLLLWRGGR